MFNMIYGTAWKKEQTTRLVELAIECGFRAIDTACQPKHYQEDLVGLALEKVFENGVKREDIFIQTKFTPINGQDLNNMPYLKSDDIITQLEKSFAKSKENLKVDFIDSYILHSPIYPLDEMIQVFTKMQEFIKNGQIGQIGISNCYDFELLKFLYNEAKIELKVVQNRFYKESNYDKQIRKFCKQNGITYQSFWSLTANPHILASKELQVLAKKYEKTVVQVFYRFLNHIGVTALNGTTSKIHMLEDMDIDSFTLLSKEIESIKNLLGNS